MPFSIKKTVTVTRTTDFGIPLSPASEEMDLMFKVSGLSISEAGKTAVVMVSADGGAEYQFFENVTVNDDTVISLTAAEEYIRNTEQYQ